MHLGKDEVELKKEENERAEHGEKDKDAKEQEKVQAELKSELGGVERIGEEGITD